MKTAIIKEALRLKEIAEQATREEKEKEKIKAELINAIKLAERKKYKIKNNDLVKENKALTEKLAIAETERDTALFNVKEWVKLAQKAQSERNLSDNLRIELKLDIKELKAENDKLKIALYNAKKEK